MFDKTQKPLFALAVALSLCANVQAQTSTSASGPYYATPSWDQKLPSATRFVVLSNWGGQAVLDRETGLVWTLELASAAVNYAAASTWCPGVTTGDRAGWRLPTIAELLRTTVVGRAPIGDSPFAFLAPGRWVTLWSSTPQTFDDTFREGSFIAVDNIWVLSLNSVDFAPSGVSRIGAAKFGSVWCVQSPGVIQ